MGIGRYILRGARKKLADKVRKKAVGSLSRKLYKYKDPLLGSSLGLTNVPLIDTPNSLDDENFTKYYNKLTEEGLVKDVDGVGSGVIDPDDLLKFWRENSYHRQNPIRSWAQTVGVEGSAFIPWAGLPISMGLGELAEKNADSENWRIYQDIRRKAYEKMGKEFVQNYEPQTEEE